MEENKGKQPNTKTKATATEGDQKATVTPRLAIRGNKVLQHHLFESNVTSCLKNVSYTPDQPDLKEMPHKHFFHTIDSRGKKLTQSSMILNHYHDMEWWMDQQTGDLKCKSGPAKRLETKRYKSGMTEVVPSLVMFNDERHPQPWQDEHRHAWDYVDTEEFTPNSLEARRKENRAEVGAVTVKPLQNAAPFTSADPVRIDEAPETLKRP